MAWSARLGLHYTRAERTTQVRFEHQGPLRILRSLYPEGPGICHNVLIHPPSGLVGGDTLDIDIRASANAHALLTTPGATRFYKSSTEWAEQNVRIHLDNAARLEWLPLESIAYNGCMGKNNLHIHLQGDSELLGWDTTALGMPSSRLPFVQGVFEQSISLEGHWLERGRIRASDTQLLNSPLGLNAKRCLSTIFFLTAKPMSEQRRASMLEAARSVCANQAQLTLNTEPLQAGASSPSPHVVVLRTLSMMVEPSVQLLRRVRINWRQEAWGLEGAAPRIWAL